MTGSDPKPSINGPSPLTSGSAGLTQPTQAPAVRATTVAPGPGAASSVKSEAGEGSLPSQNQAGPSSLKRKRKLEAAGYTGSEIAEIQSRAAAFDLALALDQDATLYPTPPTAFTSYEDVVERLMPYHVWQVPDEELLVPTEEREAEDTKQSAELVNQLVNIRKRFAKVRRREGENASDVTSLIKLIQESTTLVRDELQTVHGQLRQARAQQEAVEAERRRAREAAFARHREQLWAEDDRRKREAYIASLRATAGAQQTALAAARPNASGATQRPPLVAAAAANASPSMAPRLPAPASTPSTPVSSTPATGTSTPLSPTRGRPRGRPRGRGRGGLREAVLTHSSAAAPTTPTGSSSTPPSASSPSPTSIPASTPPTPGIASTPLPKSGEPVQITVPMNQLPQYVAARILVLPQDATQPKAPATVIRTSEDRKSATLSINLGACNQVQLQTLARLLNVQARPGAGMSGSSAAGPATPTGGVSGSSPGTPLTGAQMQTKES